MPELSLAESIKMSLNAQEPWPDNVKLFQPYEVEQILLPDNASCLAVQAFLKMCNLPFEVEMRWNAEFMSPSGRVPFIKCGAFVVSELEPIVQFVANKGISLCSRLSTEEKAEMRAYMSLITNVLVNAELYVSWLDEDTYNTVTKIRNSSVYPWPLGWMQTRNKRSSVIKRLKALHWHEKTMDQVLADVEQCCNSLSQRLGDKDYFFGIPTPLDALVYGHVRALLSANGPQAPLFIKTLTMVLLRHVRRVANLIEMKLMYQEDCLITQALKVSDLSVPPNDKLMDRGDRQKKCKTNIGSVFKDCMFDAKDVFGFKPFTSKQIVMMTSKEGKIMCEYHEPFENKSEPIDQKTYSVKSEPIDQKTYSVKSEIIDQNTYSVVSEIIDEIIEKVEEVSIADFVIFKDKNDFEVIYPTSMGEIDLGNVEMSVNDFLDTIEEKDTTDSISQETDVEDVIRVINDSDHEAVNDYRFINNKNISDESKVINLDDAKGEESIDMGHYSGMDYFRDEETIQQKDNSIEGLKSFISKDFDDTIEQKKPEECSIETLLTLLKRKNSAYELLCESSD